MFGCSIFCSNSASRLISFSLRLNLSTSASDQHPNTFNLLKQTTEDGNKAFDLFFLGGKNPLNHLYDQERHLYFVDHLYCKFASGRNFVASDLQWFIIYKTHTCVHTISL